MSEEQAFRDAMRKNPNDHNVRLVYADWLEEHGNPVAAHRLRWWVGAKGHLDAGPTSGSAVPTNEDTSAVERTLPDWVARLHQVRAIRRLLSTRSAGKHEGVRDALHAAERWGVGDLTPDEQTDARHAARQIPLAALHPNAGSVYFGVNGVLFADPLAHIMHPVLDDVARPTGDALTNRYRYAHDTQRLRDYVKTNPPPDENTRLARPIEWAKRLLGFSAPVRQYGDGIVHKATDPTAAYAEHNAVMQAIRMLGGTSVATPERARQYVNWIAAFVKHKPDNPAVKKYVETATPLAGAGVQGTGPHLTEAVKPLVGAANLLMHSTGKDSRFVKPESLAAPVHVPPMETHQTVSPDVDLSDVPSETADALSPVERTKVILDALRKGGRDGAVKHLMENHGYTDRARALRHVRDAINRAKRAVDKPTKLAAYKGGPIGPEHISGNTAARDPYTGDRLSFHTPIEGTSLAYDLRRIQQKYPTLQAPVERALTNRSHVSGSSDDPYVAIGKELKKRGDPLAEAHEWEGISQHLGHDAAVQKAVRDLVSRERLIKNRENSKRVRYESEHERELAYWDTIARADKSKNADEFWSRLESTLGGRAGNRESIKESIERIRSRALDRAYTAATEDKHEFRDVMGAKV